MSYSQNIKPANYLHFCNSLLQEHHLQRAISAQQVYGSANHLVIPTPEFQSCSTEYETLYDNSCKQTKQYIHMQRKYIILTYWLGNKGSIRGNLPLLRREILLLLTQNCAENYRPGGKKL